MIWALLQAEGGLQLCPTSPQLQKNITPLNEDLSDPPKLNLQTI